MSEKRVNTRKTAFLYLVAILLGILIPLSIYMFLSVIAHADYYNPTYCRVYDKTDTYLELECSVDVFNTNDQGVIVIFGMGNLSWNSLNLSMIKSVYYNNYAVLLTFYNETDNNGNPVSVVISSIQNGVYNNLNASNGFSLNITYYDPTSNTYIDKSFDLTPVNGYSVSILNQSYLIASLVLTAKPTQSSTTPQAPSPPSNPWDIFGWLRFIAYLIALGIQFLMAGLSFIPSLLDWIARIGLIAVSIIPIHILISMIVDPIKGVEAIRFWYNLFRQLGEWVIWVVQALADLIDSILPG